MTWTYTVTDLASSPKDQLRLMIGDINPDSPLLQDEEIARFLTMRSTIPGAAAECCRSLATRFATLVTQQAGDTKISYSDTAKAYMKLASTFELQAAQTGAGLPYAGGISVTDKTAAQDDPDRVQPSFTIGLDDNFIPVSPVDTNTAAEGGS